MKKLLIFLTVSFVALILVACGDSRKEAVKDQRELKITDKHGNLVEPLSEEEVEAKKAGARMFLGHEDTEVGNFDIASPSGSTADGSLSVVVYDPDTFPTSLAITISGFDGSLLTYVYADGFLLTKEQYGETQSEIELQGLESAITKGKHKLQLVQYENDNEEADILILKTQEYEIKEK